MRDRPSWTFILILMLAAAPAAPAHADMLDSLLPPGVPGFDTQPGVTVQSRLHPELQPLGLHFGAFRFYPRLDESTGFDTNVLPGASHRGSWEVITAPSLVIGSDWSTDALGATLALTDTRYLALPSQSRTDGTASVGWRLDLGRNQFTLSAAHLSQHEDRGQVGTLASDEPVAFKADTIGATYTANDGRWTIEPGLRVTNWLYDNTTVLGVPTSQAYRDHVTAQGDVTLRYEWAPLRNILFVVHALGQDYTSIPAGQPSPDSTSVQILSGISDNADAVWHWRLLLGGETRGFTSPLYPRRNNLIAEAGLGWEPSGFTSIGVTLSRESTDAAQAGVSGLMLTTGRLTIDHEYFRNLLLRASLGLQQADFFGGGHQNGIVAGLGATWVMNRSIRLSATYDDTSLHGTNDPAQGLIGSYHRGIGLITVRLGL
ncbi:MAG TPA: outer membrane beta-barrel protein [Rhodopila sp.]|nr:outer membrane beta-barrel protein [Rhodopila sp.]